MSDLRPRPNTRGIAERFWRGAANGELWFQRCEQCTAPFYPARIVCPICGSAQVAWERSTGTGTVYSYSVIYRNAEPFFHKRLPYVLALVDVDPGFRMMTNIVNAAPERVTIGMPVRAAFEKASNDLGFPLFEPA